MILVNDRSWADTGNHWLWCMKDLEQTLITTTLVYKGSWADTGNHDSVVWRILIRCWKPWLCGMKNLFWTVHSPWRSKSNKATFQECTYFRHHVFHLYICLTECLHQFCHFKVSIIFILLYEFLLPSSKSIIANYTGSSHMLISSLPSSSSVDMQLLSVVPSPFCHSISLLINFNLSHILANFCDNIFICL